MSEEQFLTRSIAVYFADKSEAQRATGAQGWDPYEAQQLAGALGWDPYVTAMTLTALLRDAAPEGVTFSNGQPEVAGFAEDSASSRLATYELEVSVRAPSRFFSDPAAMGGQFDKAVAELGLLSNGRVDVKVLEPAQSTSGAHRAERTFTPEGAAQSSAAVAERVAPVTLAAYELVNLPRGCADRVTQYLRDALPQAEGIADSFVVHALGSDYAAVYLAGTALTPAAQGVGLSSTDEADGRGRQIIAGILDRLRRGDRSVQQFPFGSVGVIRSVLPLALQSATFQAPVRQADERRPAIHPADRPLLRQHARGASHERHVRPLC